MKARRTLVLSTMYLQRQADVHDLPALAVLASDLGFDGLELGHVVEPAALTRLHPGATFVPAVHHPCPAEPGALARCGLVARDGDHRRSLVAALGRTIDTAARYGAHVVVVHVGQVQGAMGQAARRTAFELASRYAAGQRDTARYRAVLDQHLARVEAAEAEQLPSVVDTLAEVLPRCQDAGLTLALETAYHPDELPTPAGMHTILDAMDRRAVGAWLDTGHVGAWTNLGLASFAEWHKSVGPRWLGAHLHDVVGLRDHLPAGAGTLDFSAALAVLPPTAHLTCEFDWYFDAEEVRAGRAVIEAAGA